LAPAPVVAADQPVRMDPCWLQAAAGGLLRHASGGRTWSRSRQTRPGAADISTSRPWLSVGMCSHGHPLGRPSPWSRQRRPRRPWALARSRLPAVPQGPVAGLGEQFQPIVFVSCERRPSNFGRVHGGPLQRMPSHPCAGVALPVMPEHAANHDNLKTPIGTSGYRRPPAGCEQVIRLPERGPVRRPHAVGVLLGMPDRLRAPLSRILGGGERAVRQDPLGRAWRRSGLWAVTLPYR
jgi:hypothetical protein